MSEKVGQGVSEARLSHTFQPFVKRQECFVSKAKLIGDQRHDIFGRLPDRIL